MARRPARRFCSCGASLRWERTGSPAIWLATCDSASCGQVTLPVSQRQELAGFLGASSKPLAKPWTRLFVQVVAAGGVGLEIARVACEVCDEPDLRFRLLLHPLPYPNQATLCLRCGAVSVKGFSDVGRFIGLAGGLDWTTPDEAVMALRRGIRERAELETPEWDVE